LVRLSSEDTATLRGLRNELDTVVVDRAGALDNVLYELRGLLRAENTVLARMREMGQAWDMDLFHSSGLPEPAAMQRRLSAFFSTAPRRFAWYNAVSPEAEQRNKVVEAISRIPPGEYEASRLHAEVMAPLSLEKHKQLRVLVCDGPSLLAWFGAFIPEAVNARQEQILNSLVPSLRRRLVLEQKLREAPRLAVALEVALEHLGSPAFILGAKGQIKELNVAARVLLEQSSLDITAELRESAAARATRLTCELIPLRDQGYAVGWLAIVRLPTPSADTARSTRAAMFAARWNLTPRQRQVLELIASGATNSRIGAELGISERTVEDHVAAILAKAEVVTRAGLIGAMLA
jgi:DNA-binding CsgD family transcriptional regulator